MLNTIKNKHFSLSFDRAGNVVSFLPTGGANVAKCTKLSVILDNDKNEHLPVEVDFDGNIITTKYDNGIVSKVSVKDYENFITFTLEEVSSEDFFAIKFINISVDIDYDNEEDDPLKYSACLIGMTLATHSQEHSGKNELLIASAYPHIGIAGNSRSPYKPACAVFISTNKDLFEIEKQVLNVIPDGEIPKSEYGGPYASNCEKSARKTYTLHWTPITEENYDEHVAYFKEFGLEQINLHHFDYYMQGSYEIPKKSYPGGLEELKKITKRLKADGFELGFHPYVFFIRPEDKLVTPIPHDDIDVMNEFTLAKDLDESATEIFTVESLKGVTPERSYVICNSQTLRIDDELVMFNKVDEEGRFYEVVRGHLGTKIAKHSKGAKISQFKEYFYFYLAKPGSELFYELARNAAKFYNEIGFDSIYFDALDGAAQLDGEDYAWYHGIDFVREFFNHIDHPPVFDGCHNLQYTGTWSVRSRYGALDREINAFNEYKDAQMRYNQKISRRMGVTEELGWIDIYPTSSLSDYFIQLMPRRKENTAYLYSKLMAFNSCTTYLETLKHRRSIPIIKETASYIKEYTDYKNAHELSSDSIKYLRKEGNFGYIIDGTLRKSKFIPFRFQHKDKVNKINNPFNAQKPYIRLEGLYSAKDYESDGVILTEGMTMSDGFVKNIRIPRTDLSKRIGMGVWVKGDNGGGQIKITIGILKGGKRTRGCFFIDNDFEGWKYFAQVDHQQGDSTVFPMEEIDCSTYANLQKFYGYYIGAVDYSVIETIDVEYLGGGTVEIKPLKAVDHESRDIVNPTLIINGKPITFNVTLSSAHTLELDFEGNCRVIDKEFNVLSNPTYTGEIPVMESGENLVTFSSESEKLERVRVTLGIYGEPLL